MVLSNTLLEIKIYTPKLEKILNNRILEKT